MKPAQQQPANSAFRFDSAELFKDIQYIGNGSSHFQSEPFMYDADGQPIISSDWEWLLNEKMHGKLSKIPLAETVQLPRFLRNREDYVRRSAELGCNMMRVSIDFSRLCPQPGVFNEQLMAEYVQTLTLIKSSGQQPFLTLHHFTMPKYLLEIDSKGEITAGAWENSEAVQHFRFYIEKVLDFLANKDQLNKILAQTNLNKDLRERFIAEGLVQFFMTFNEPGVTITNGYLTGSFPPFKKNAWLTAKKVFNKMVQANQIARELIKTKLSAQTFVPQVGIGYNWQFYEGPLAIIGKMWDSYYTGSLEKPAMHSESDFLGLHYYFRTKTSLFGIAPRSSNLEYGEQPTFGDIYPPGILRVLLRMHRHFPNKPIFVSEFGFSESSDTKRPYWILQTARYILEAKKQGVPIKGLLLWTMVNNFEWDFGTSQKFGLCSESELTEPLQTKSIQQIKSWQVWQSLCKAITHPSPENLRNLQNNYEIAYSQYKKTGGKY